MLYNNKRNNVHVNNNYKFIIKLTIILTFILYITLTIWGAYTNNNNKNNTVVFKKTFNKPDWLEDSNNFRHNTQFIQKYSTNYFQYVNQIRSLCGNSCDYERKTYNNDGLWYKQYTSYINCKQLFNPQVCFLKAVDHII